MLYDINCHFFQIRKTFLLISHSICFGNEFAEERYGKSSEHNLTMIWCQIIIQLVHLRLVQSSFLLNFDIDNCLLKKFIIRCDQLKNKSSRRVTYGNPCYSIGSKANSIYFLNDRSVLPQCGNIIVHKLLS
jgi:hypothetical protein